MGSTVTAPAPARRVLLVGRGLDDEGRLAADLGARGYEIDRSADATEAAARTRSEIYGALVAHWNGETAAIERLLRHEGDGPRPWRILVTENPDAAEAALAAGADDLIAGPADAAKLVTRLRVGESVVRLRERIRQQSDTLIEANRRLQRANQRMVDELDSAARVQQALLPAAGFGAPGLGVGWRLRPCEGLAGDLLNCLRLDEHHVAFFVLDVSGHGVSAALLSVQVSRLMSPLLSESQLLKQRLDRPPWYSVVEPVEVVRQLNRMFQASEAVPQYFTIVYGLLHSASGHVRFATAGHPGPLHVDADGTTNTFDCRSHPVGFVDDPSIDERELTLAPGERLWFFSDGVIDAETRTDTDEGEQLGLDGLRRHVERAHGHECDSAVETVMDGVLDWCAPGSPDDDCSLLLLERRSED